MSSFDTVVRALMLGAALALSACTVSPLYGPTASGRNLTTDLSAVTITAPTTRADQTVRNALIFAFTGGGSPAKAPLYELALRVDVTQSLVGVTRIETAPSYNVNVAAAYELKRIATGEIIHRGVARGTASYDRSNQAFANVRARLDAEERAANSAADQIRLSVAAALVTGG